MSDARKKARNRADKYFSLYIRARDGRCVNCGTTEQLTCGHLFSSAHYSTRWDERNAFCQCTGCNLKHEHDPYPLIAYYLSLHSQEDLDRLHAKWSTATKLTTNDILEIGSVYLNKLKDFA